MNIDDIRGSVARGWCQPETSSKVMDPDLAEAIAQQVHADLAAAEAEKARAVEAETERCAAMLDTEADKCDNAARWGGSKRYVTDCKAAAYALRDRAAAIRTGVKP